MKFPIDATTRALLELVKIVYYKGQQDALQQTDVPVTRITPFSDDVAVQILIDIEQLQK